MRTKSVIFAGILAGLTACQTPETEATAVQTPKTRPRANAEALNADTRLPDTFGKPLASSKAGLVKVPPGMLLLSEIVRPRAELRTGPGIQFELSDRILTQGTRVIVFMKVGVWAKVVVPGNGWQSGWVHGQTLAAARPNDKPMTIDPNRLPTVIALNPVGSVASFPEQKELPVTIPKGAMFRSLRFADKKALIYLPETNSVMWMSRKDVQ